MQQYSGVQVLSFSLLLIGTAASIFALSTSHWSSFSYSLRDSTGVLDAIANAASAIGFKSGRRGLWIQCNTPRVGDLEECSSRFDTLRSQVEQGEFSVPQNFKPLEIVCLALMIVSAGLGVLALFLAPCVCHRCGCCLSIFVFVAGLSAAAAVGCYTYFHLSGQIATDVKSLTFVDRVEPESFGYSFWCAVAAAVSQVFASLLFAGDSRSHDYSHTI